MIAGTRRTRGVGGPAGARWVERAARLGHVATGAVYLILGGVALTAIFDVRIRPMGSQGALHVALTGPIGRLLLLAIAVGLTLDFVWQIVRAVKNVDATPRTLKGFADRAGWAVSGAVHLGLAITAAKLAFAVPQESAERATKERTALIVGLPVGRWLIVMAAFVIVLVGLHLIRRAWIGDVDRWLDLRSLPRLNRVVILVLGRLGLAARGVVFGAGGLLLGWAALQNRPWDARGVGGTLRALQSMPLGSALLAAVAIGLIGFGVVELASARYRRIAIRPS